MSDFQNFCAFLDSLPATSPVFALHEAFNAAENALMDLTSEFTVAEFSQTGTALRDCLEEGGFTRSGLVKAYADHIESSIKLAKTIIRHNAA